MKMRYQHIDRVPLYGIPLIVDISMETDMVDAQANGGYSMGCWS